MLKAIVVLLAVALGLFVVGVCGTIVAFVCGVLWGSALSWVGFVVGCVIGIIITIAYEEFRDNFWSYSCGLMAGVIVGGIVIGIASLFLTADDTTSIIICIVVYAVITFAFAIGFAENKKVAVGLSLGTLIGIGLSVYILYFHLADVFRLVTANNILNINNLQIGYLRTESWIENWIIAASIVSCTIVFGLLSDGTLSRVLSRFASLLRKLETVRSFSAVTVPIYIGVFAFLFFHK
ncbi:hypothetical protein AGMMS49975_09870 [Clostridia bacterium]|nr:hypothetical protein AGMMS49975_09870 [Clostridia bacterium]